jgi:hypothetical protein
LHFYDDVGAYLAYLAERKLERNIFISQLILYDENQARLQRDSNILKFWSLLPFTQLSRGPKPNTLLDTPANQVGVERFFLIVKFIFSPICTIIGGTLLSGIVFLKANQVNFSNKCFFYTLVA